MMKRWMGGPGTAARLSLMLAAGAMFAPAQTVGVSPASPATSPVAQQPATQAPVPQISTASPEGRFERFDFGVRVRFFPSKSYSAMGNKDLQTTTTTPVYDWNFRTTSRSPAVGGGIATEIHLTRKTSFRAEVIFNRLRYDKVTDIYWGGDDPVTNNDERSHMIRTERTKARLFDVPLMMQYRGFGSEGIRAHMYLAAGAVVRNISTIRTTNETVFTNAAKETTQGSVLPSKRNLVGATVGLGFRFIDDYRIKTTPEIRYTRWGGSTFGSDSTQSPRNQFEVSIGFTF